MSDAPASDAPEPDDHDPEPSPMAVAMVWVGRITTVVGEMVVPGLIGQWADRRWGTGYWTLVGFALGLTLGIWHLVKMTGVAAKRSAQGSAKKSTRRSTKR